MLVSPSILWFFAGKVLKTLASGSAMHGSQKKDEESKQTAGSKIQPDKKKKTASFFARRKKQKVENAVNNLKVLAMQWAIYFVVFGIYVPTGMYMYLFFIINESYQGSFSVMYTTKTVIDLYLWFATTGFVAYLLFRVITTRNSNLIHRHCLQPALFDRFLPQSRLMYLLLSVVDNHLFTRRMSIYRKLEVEQETGLKWKVIRSQADRVPDLSALLLNHFQNS